MNIVEEMHFNRKMKVFEKRPKNVMSMLKETVEQYPEKEALVMNGIRLTYQIKRKYTLGHLRKPQSSMLNFVNHGKTLFLIELEHDKTY